MQELGMIFKSGLFTKMQGKVQQMECQWSVK